MSHSLPPLDALELLELAGDGDDELCAGADVEEAADALLLRDDVELVAPPEELPDVVPPLEDDDRDDDPPLDDPLVVPADETADDPPWLEVPPLELPCVPPVLPPGPPALPPKDPPASPSGALCTPVVCTTPSSSTTISR